MVYIGIDFNDDEFIGKYIELGSSRKMAKYYGCDKSTILNHANKIGFHNDLKYKLSDKDKEEIVLAYDTMSSVELAEKYNVSRGMITKVWHDNLLHGKSRNIYPFNYDYFESIDTKDKAYFLGLIAADGNITIHKGTGSSILRVTLNSKDEDILYTMSAYVSSEKPVRSYCKNINGAERRYSSIELVSSKMADDLNKYGIIENKTHSYIFKESFDNRLTSHFIRGYFDGDGSIALTKGQMHTPSNFQASISGYKHNLLSMISTINKHTGVLPVYTNDNREDKYSDPNFGSLRFANIKDTVEFLSWMYQDCDDLYIARKKYRFDCLINSINKNYSNKNNIYKKIDMPS